MKNDNRQTPPDTKQSRKPYQQPELQVYGNLRDITQTLGMTGVDDNLSMLTKTSA